MEYTIMHTLHSYHCKIAPWFYVVLIKLGWKPKYDLGMLVKEMVEVDLNTFKKEKLLKESGFYIKNQFE